MTTYIKGTFPVRFRRDGKDGVGINSVNTYYALGDSLTVSPSDSKYIYDTLTDVVISTNSDSYVWSGDKIMYTNGNASLTGKYCIGKCSELASVTEQYGTSSSATAEPKSWSDSYPTSLSSGIYIWTRDKIVWKNNNVTYSTAKKVGYISKDGELGFGIVVSLTRNQYTEEELNEYFEVGHQEFWSLNSESEKNGCRIGDIFMVSGIAKNTKSLHAAYFRCTDNTKSKRLDGISIRHDIIEKGDKGEDAYSYKLRSNISAIPLDNNGMPVDSAKSLTLTGNIFKGSSLISVSTSYTIKAIITWNGTASDTKTSSNGSLTVDLSTYKNIVKVACSFLYGSTVLDSFDILPIKAGAAGVSYFPNMCGVWDGANVTYKWTNGSRDMVTFYVGGTPYLFAVKTAGTTISANVNNATPDKDSRWEKADSPFSMLFANFVYTDNASVAGFKWSDEVMQSPNGLLELNGKTGKITAKSAEIEGIINAKSGQFENCTINNTCRILQNNGDGWFLIGGTDPTADAPNGKPSYWLGYSGNTVGSFSMESAYQEEGYLPARVKMSIKTPRITSSGTSGGTMFEIYSNIDHALAYISHAFGMGVSICPTEGVGIRFDKNSVDSNIVPIAFYGSGHGCLNGVIQGYQINNTFPSNGVIDLSYGNTVYCAKQGGSITLPKRTNCQSVLGTKGAFAIDLTIIAASGASNFKVYGKSDDNNTDCYLLDNNHANNWHATMSQGDVLQLKLIYTGNYFYAYVVSFKQ